MQDVSHPRNNLGCMVKRKGDGTEKAGKITAISFRDEFEAVCYEIQWKDKTVSIVPIDPGLDEAGYVIVH